MKIGLVPDQFLGSQGGRDFFSMLADSLSRALEPEDEIRILSVVRRDTRSRRVARIAKHFLTRFPPDLKWPKNEFVEILSELRTGRGKHSNLPDVIGPWYGSKPSGLDVACLGYIYDCQHLRLPNNFSSNDIMARNTRFAKILQEMPVVIVNSENARSDLLHFFPRVKSDIVSLPFSASASPEWLAVDSAAARKKYRIPSRYFLCSNQFWQHKNHETVVEAVALARIEGRPISMVFTGAMEDYRAPEYVSSLMRRVKNLGVAEDCLFLGLIQKLDQIAIMKSAVAVIQPTLFEGGPGGGAVHDAISVGSPVIVSDIPVNREIEKYVDAFFPPRDPASLLRAMRSIESAKKEKKPASVLLAEGQERRQQCGKILKSAFALAMRRAVRRNRTTRQSLKFVEVKISS